MITELKECNNNEYRGWAAKHTGPYGDVRVPRIEQTKDKVGSTEQSGSHTKQSLALRLREVLPAQSHESSSLNKKDWPKGNGRQRLW